MKKRQRIMVVLLPVIVTLTLFFSFYEKIQTKPSEPGFWVILALGMSLGVAITRFAQMIKKSVTEEK